MSGWLDGLLAGLQAAQGAVLHLLAAVGIAGTAHGQAAWPFDVRLTGDVLLIDRSVARQLATALAASAAAVLLLLFSFLAWYRRRGRLRLRLRLFPIVLLAAAAVLLVAAPWPDSGLLLTQAYPTSFHTSPTGFSAPSIVRGQQLYTQFCVACHGADGRGNTPLALAQTVSPPNLAGPLLSRRADGEVFWRIQNGTRDPQRPQAGLSMQGFARQLSDADTWALIDFMKANAAGVSLQTNGNWEQPIAAPALAIQCGSAGRGSRSETLAQWRGQRVRIVASAVPPAQVVVREDPRLLSVVLSDAVSPAVLPLPDSRPAGAAAVDCAAQSQAAWQALAIIAGIAPDRLDGMQFLVDRGGWLRARKQKADGTNGAAAGWSDADMLCRTASDGVKPSAAPAADGLGKLIALMDAEPIQLVKGGFVHR